MEGKERPKKESGPSRLAGGRLNKEGNLHKEDNHLGHADLNSHAPKS